MLCVCALVCWRTVTTVDAERGRGARTRPAPVGVGVIVVFKRAAAIVGGLRWRRCQPLWSQQTWPWPWCVAMRVPDESNPEQLAWGDAVASVLA